MVPPDPPFKGTTEIVKQNLLVLCQRKTTLKLAFYIYLTQRNITNFSCINIGIDVF